MAGDLSSKLRVAVVPVGPEGYLCAWTYRQGRRQGTTLRRWGVPGTVWRSDEWLLAAGADWTLGATPPPRQPRGDEDMWPYRLHQEEWVCRHAGTGEERWRVDGTGRVVMGTMGSLLVVADLSAGERERCERTDRLFDAWAEERITLQEMQLAEAAPVTCGSALLALDPRTGRTAWRTHLPGQIASATSDSHGVSAICVNADGTVWLHHLDRAGRLLGSHQLGPGGHELVGRTDTGAVVLTRDDAGTALVGRRWDEPGPAWRLPVGYLDVAFPPRAVDARRVTVSPGLVTGGHCYLRERRSVLVVDCRD